MTPPPLTAVAATLSLACPHFDAVEPVVRLVSDFAAAFLRLPIVKVAAKGDVQLFDRVVHYHETGLVLSPAVRSNRYARSMRKAVEKKHVAIVQRIHALHPTRLGVRSFTVAAEAGALDVLQWLFRHRHDGLCVNAPPDELNSPSDVYCCMRDVMNRAMAKPNTEEVVGWLVDRVCLHQVDEQVVYYLIAAGDLNRLRTLCDRKVVAVAELWFEIAANHGQVEIVKWLFEAMPWYVPTPAMVEKAWLGGNIQLINFVANKSPPEVLAPPSIQSVRRAAMHGRRGLLEFLIPTLSDPAEVTQLAIEALRNGQYDTFKWICELPSGEVSAVPVSEVPFSKPLDHLGVVQWIHMRNIGSWSTAVMDEAARCGQLDVVKWLHENRDEGCTTNAMDSAAFGGHLPVVEFLHTHRSEGCTTSAMDNAARKGHFEIVKWLHANRSEGCSERAMDTAASAGHLRIVEWLVEHRGMTCTGIDIAGAAANGHLNVVNWLRTRFPDSGCAPWAIEYTARNSADLEVLMYLYPDICSTPVCSLKCNDQVVVEWLVEEGLVEWSLDILMNSVRQGKLWLLMVAESSTRVIRSLDTNSRQRLLHVATEAQHISIINWLQELEVEVEQS